MILKHETFEAKDFVRSGLVLTVVAVALVMLLGMTYWHWLGYVQATTAPAARAPPQLTGSLPDESTSR